MYIAYGVDGRHNCGIGRVFDFSLSVQGYVLTLAWLSLGQYMLGFDFKSIEVRIYLE